jgi:hypothetical protein
MMIQERDNDSKPCLTGLKELEADNKTSVLPIKNIGVNLTVSITVNPHFQVIGEAFGAV